MNAELAPMIFNATFPQRLPSSKSSRRKISKKPLTANAAMGEEDETRQFYL